MRSLPPLLPIVRACKHTSFLTLSPQVMDKKYTLDDMPEILQKLATANKSGAAKHALDMLVDVASDEMAAQQVARSAVVVPRLVGWCESKVGARSVASRPTATDTVHTCSQSVTTKKGCSCILYRTNKGLGFRGLGSRAQGLGLRF